MATLESSVTVNRAAEDVFAYLTDPHRRPEWQQTCVEVRDVPDRIEAGASWIDVEKREGPIPVTLVAYEPHHRYVDRIDSRVATVDVTVTLRPQGDATEVHARADGQPRGIWRVLFPVMKPTFRRQLHRDLTGVRDNLEARSRPTR